MRIIIHQILIIAASFLSTMLILGGAYGLWEEYLKPLIKWWKEATVQDFEELRDKIIGIVITLILLIITCLPMYLILNHFWKLP